MSLTNHNIKIDHPFPLTANDKTRLTTNPPKTTKDWTASRFTGLKKRIKEYYSAIQEDVCPYCRLELRRGGYGEPIEHIVPKDDFTDWMFEPFNLALSCYGCNTKKNSKTTLTDITIPLPRPYPKASGDFLIVHPHIDVYSGFITIKHNMFYSGLNAKGIHTIKVCDLNRLDVLFYKAKQSGLVNDNSIQTKLTSIQTLPGIEPDIVKVTLEMLKVIKRSYKIRKQAGMI